MLNKGDIEKSFQEVLSSMEEGVDYELTPDALEEINSGSDITPLTSVCFRKTSHGDVDIHTFSAGECDSYDLRKWSVFSSPIVLAIAENRIQKVQQSCEGKIVKVDGKKYKLVAV